VGNKLLAAALAAWVAFVATPVYATQPTDGLERYDYSELFLLRVTPGGPNPSACFGTLHEHVWIHLHETVGNRYGSMDSVLKDKVHIDQPTPVNGTDWLPVNFYWPVAHGDLAERLAKSCGDKPDR
jgi:hypothetical protein